ncbi:ATP-binding cassette domain-containing protein [Shigella flexneri]
MVAIVGASGSGTSTLMNTPVAGSGHHPHLSRRRSDVATLDADALAQLRRQHFGFIFQRYHLLSHLTAEQNVEASAVYAGLEWKQRLLRAQESRQRLGWKTVEHLSGTASGGQQQRVSIAGDHQGGQVLLPMNEPAHWTAILAKR